MQGCRGISTKAADWRRSYHEAIIQLTFEPSSDQDFIMTTLERYRGCLLGLAAGMLSAPRWNSNRRAISSRSRTWSAAGHSI